MASFERERRLAREVWALLRGQAGRKQAGELARKSSNQIWRNASVGVCGNDCPCGRPFVFSDWPVEDPRLSNNVVRLYKRLIFL